MAAGWGSVLAMLVAFVGVGDASDCRYTSTDMLKYAGLLGNKLAKQGYTVIPGEARWQLSCQNSTIEDCSGDDNPNGGYMEYLFPSSAVPPVLCEINSMETCTENYTMSTPMGPLDAMVWMGCSPPPNRYFSFDMIVASRIVDYGDGWLGADWFYPGCPFGDALNTLNAPFGDDEPAVVVHAFDNTTVTAVETSLSEVEHAKDAVLPLHVHPLNASLVNLWYDWDQPVNDTRPDSFRPLIRWSVPKAGSTAESFENYSATTWPVLLVRKEVDEPVQLLNPELRKRQDGLNETEVYGGKVQKLEDTIIEWMSSEQNMTLSGTAQLNVQLPGMGDDWDEVLNQTIPTFDYLNTRDAVYGYPWAGDEDSRTPKDCSVGCVAFLVGVVHTNVNKTTYSSVTFASEDLTYSSTYLDSQMTGSARAFSKLGRGNFEEDEDIDNLFALAWRRETSTFLCPKSVKEFCNTVPALDLYPNDAVLQVLSGDRAYLHPTQMTGPAPEETFGARILLFRPNDW